MPFDMSDYVEVSERLVNLFAKHPEASMRGTYEVLTLGTDTFIAYRAECYRTADDLAPGVGMAWEPVPGKTSYTKGSELQNAETSAWGRAIVAVGASESKRIASANEMRSAQAHQNARRVSTPTPVSPDSVPWNAHSGPPPAPTASASATSPSRRQALKSRCVALQADNVSVAELRDLWHLPKIDDSSDEQLEMWEDMLRGAEENLTKPFVETSAQ